jgi:putative transposase
MALLAHIIALRPTPAQVRLFRKAAGCARLAYHWALDHWNSECRAGRKPTWMSLQKTFTARRPRFKAKRREQPSFKTGKVRFVDGYVILPVIGAIRSTEPLRWAGRVVSSTVREDADQWTVSVLCDVPEEQAEPIPPAPPTTAVIGIDLGLHAFATCSDGRKILAPKPLRLYGKRLKRASRRLSRRHRGSRRREKARRRVARLHRRIRHIRSAFLHPLTTSLVRENQTLVIEDLHIRGMLTNHRLARANSDAGWHEIRRQLVYKAVRYRRTVLAAPAFYPSSKRCSHCGSHHPTLTLADRIYDCCACGMRRDRDINAAVNLASVSTPAHGGIDAREEPTALVVAGCLQDQPARRSVNSARSHKERKKSTRIIGLIPGLWCVRTSLTVLVG